MSALASLVRAYDRLHRLDQERSAGQRHQVPEFGFARTDVGYCIVLRADGTPAFAPIRLRQGEGKQTVRRKLDLPTPLTQRTSGISPNFLWDKTAYSLGVSNESKRCAKEHDAFITFHEEALRGTSDCGLKAFVLFLRKSLPEQLAALEWSEEIIDQNIVFALEDEYRERYLHERPESVERWLQICSGESATLATCLVTGTAERIARSHPPIKGVQGAQSSGAYVISYNETAFTSYGHQQGDNAPVSERAAFAYTTVLNAYLHRDSGHKIQIGDASTVFWAEAQDAAAASVAEDVFYQLMYGIDENVEAVKVGAVLAKIRAGRPIEEIRHGIRAGVRFYVLGLSPNAGRLSVRFYFEEEFGTLAANLAQHAQDLSLEPTFGAGAPSARALLNEICVHTPVQGSLGKTVWRRSSKAMPPMTLCADLMRAILLGTPYPRSMLARTIDRIRAEGGRVTPPRAAICKAIICRSSRRSKHLPLHSTTEAIPVSLDRHFANPAYRLGRLFALMELAQQLAIPGVKAGIRDKFYGAASASPARVFPLLVSGAMHHLSAIQKDQRNKGLGFWLEREIGNVWAGLEPDLPRSLHLEDQGRFHVGYFHQRYAKSDANGGDNPIADASEDNDLDDIARENNND